MELLQKILNGENPEAILLEWKETSNSQVEIKEKLKDLLKDLPENRIEIISILKNPLFSLNLCPSLIKKSIKSNTLVIIIKDIIENILKFKGPHVSSKALGSLFIYLLTCPINAFNPSGSSYKPYKIECNRQGLLLKRSDRIRYYLLSLTISKTTAIPIFSSFPDQLCKYFAFILRYLISYPNNIPSCPSSNRFMDFLNGVLNSATGSTPLEEIYLLIEEYIKYAERVGFIHTILTANLELFPVKKLASISSLTLV